MFSDHTADKLNVNILKDNLKIPKYWVVEQIYLWKKRQGNPKSET